MTKREEITLRRFKASFFDLGDYSGDDCTNKGIYTSLNHDSTSITIEENSKMEYMVAVYNKLLQLHKAIFANQIYGKTNLNTEDNYLNLTYLPVYLQCIIDNIDIDIRNGLSLTLEEYYEKYDLQCLIDSFKCQGIELDDVLKIYDLSLIKSNCLGSQQIDFCDVCSLNNLFN